MRLSVKQMLEVLASESTESGLREAIALVIGRFGSDFTQAEYFQFMELAQAELLSDAARAALLTVVAQARSKEARQVLHIFSSGKEPYGHQTIVAAVQAFHGKKSSSAIAIFRQALQNTRFCLVREAGLQGLRLAGPKYAGEIAKVLQHKDNETRERAAVEYLKLCLAFPEARTRSRVQRARDVLRERQRESLLTPELRRVIGS